jgi:hypothetical protein
MTDETTLHIMALMHDATDEEIVSMMRQMKSIREHKSKANIVMLVNGYDSDPRELWEIPEALALFRRLIDTGFISYLDPGHVPGVSEPAEGGFGAAEVIFSVEGRMG